jgi:hypothetical protein
MPRQYPRGNVEPINKVDDFVRSSVTVGVFQNLDRIATLPNSRALIVHPSFFRSRVGILNGRSNPETPAFVERHVDRFIDHWLARKQLHRESRRNPEACPFLLCSERIASTNKTILL